MFKHVLMIGATAGIGRAMADRLVADGIKVTAVGRRQERLDDFMQTHGENAQGVAFDISNKNDIPGFAERIIQANPDLDCLFLNAGIQFPCDMTNPAGFDLDKFFEQINVNFCSVVALTQAFLPFLTQKQNPTSLIFTTSNLSVVPAAKMPAYSASKAAMNAFVLCLREQLRNTTTKVIELSPPVVQTELHDYMGVEVGRNLGMPLDQFTQQAYEGLLSGSDQVIVGSIGPADQFQKIVDQRRAAFNQLSQMMR